MTVPCFVNPLFSASLAIFSIAAFAESADKSTNNQITSEWARAAANHDGFPSQDELAPFPGLVHHFDKLDTDGDLEISESEYRSRMDGDRNKK